jgi:hypothetical protein
LANRGIGSGCRHGDDAGHLRELRRYFAPDRYGEFWSDASIHQVL